MLHSDNVSLFYITAITVFQPSMYELSDLLQRRTGMQAINGKHAIYEPFEVIYIQAFMVSYVSLSLAVLSLA